MGDKFESIYVDKIITFTAEHQTKDVDGNCLFEGGESVWGERRGEGWERESERERNKE